MAKSSSATNASQALQDLADALSDFSDKLDSYIKGSGDPFTPVMQNLRTIDTQIAVDAALIARLAVESMADDVRAALADLKQQVDRAKDTLQNINNAKTALSVVAAVLTAAAGISTGNPLAAAQGVSALVNVVAGAVDAAGA
jgi:ABC-type transporter Mla subunit MlaD